MEILYQYKDEKKSRQGSLRGNCELTLSKKDEFNFTIESTYVFLYPKRWSAPRANLTYQHRLEIDLKNCFFTITKSDCINDDNKIIKPKKIKTNDFKAINDSINRGIIYGESRFAFWGPNFRKATKKITLILNKQIKSKLKSDYYKNKEFSYTSPYDNLYIMLVDYYLDFHEIKGHDNVYHHIEEFVPKKKWLKKNEYKFLPAILESLNLKSKFLIGEISTNSNNINLSSLNFLCKLFGKNYLDYIKRIEWKEICSILNSKINKSIELKNEIEKNNFVQLCNNWDDYSNLIMSMKRIIFLRDTLEKKGLNLKFTCKTIEQFEKLETEWEILSNYFKKGHKLKYQYPEDFVNYIQQPITVDNKTFTIKLLTTEDEFKLEGIVMKNCMGNQFLNGIILSFLNIKHRKKQVNLSVQRGEVVQAYGKANTTISDDFKEPVKLVVEKFKQFPDLKWTKIKYDIIKN